jgi:hypothetical protein
MNQRILHVYPECPEGKLIAIAKRDAVNTQRKGSGLSLLRDASLRRHEGPPSRQLVLSDFALGLWS